MSSIVEDAKKLSPGWWGAIASAAGAGAMLFPESRLVAGLIAAGAMFVVARKVSAPCCAACAGEGAEQQQQAQAQPQALATESTETFYAKVMSPSFGDCDTCGVLS